MTPTRYGDCPACGQPIDDNDQPHTWTDGISDCHPGCCTCWDDTDNEAVR